MLLVVYTVIIRTWAGFWTLVMHGSYWLSGNG